MTVRQAVKENKMISVILGVIAAGLLAWGVWVTEASYKVHFTSTVELKNVCDTLENLKITDDKLKEVVETNRAKSELEIKEERQIMAAFQKEILLMFIAIQRQIKDK